MSDNRIDNEQSSFQNEVLNEVIFVDSNLIISQRDTSAYNEVEELLKEWKLHHLFNTFVGKYIIFVKAFPQEYPVP